MNSDPEEPMDNQLLQLERELFSLSPVETPRHLAARLDRQVSAPVPVGRQIAPVQRVVPFRWRRMVVPAAAAVVVVSVMNQLDSPRSIAPGFAQSNAGNPSRLPSASPVIENSGYVLRAEPVILTPAGLQAIDQQYYIRPGAQISVGGYNVPRRASGIAPVVFH